MVPRSYRPKDYRDKSLPLIGLGLLLVLFAVCARAQFSGVHQPIFSNAPSTPFVVDQEWMKYRWKNTTLATNVAITNWFDSIQNSNLTCFADVNLQFPTNTANGIIPKGAAGMGFTNTFVWTSDTIWACGVICVLDPDPDTFANFMGFLDYGGTPNATGYIIDQQTTSFILGGEGIFFGSLTPLPTNVWMDVLIASTNIGNINVYTNGVFAGNRSSWTGLNPSAPNNFGVSVGLTDHAFDGKLREIILWTNYSVNISSIATRLNQIRTNLYEP